VISSCSGSSSPSPGDPGRSGLATNAGKLLSQSSQKIRPAQSLPKEGRPARASPGRDTRGLTIPDLPFRPPDDRTLSAASSYFTPELGSTSPIIPRRGSRVNRGAHPDWPPVGAILSPSAFSPRLQFSPTPKPDGRFGGRLFLMTSPKVSLGGQTRPHRRSIVDLALSVCRQSVELPWRHGIATGSCDSHSEHRQQSIFRKPLASKAEVYGAKSRALAVHVPSVSATPA
jgi:hypothetical protein